MFVVQAQSGVCPDIYFPVTVFEEALHVVAAHGIRGCT